MLTSLGFAPRHFLSRVAAPAHWVRTNSTLANTVSYRVAYHDKAAPALVSPSEKVNWDYETLNGKVGEVAGGLAKIGYGKGDLLVTDIHQGTPSVLLQLAVAHIGGQVLTVKNAAEVETLSHDLYMKGAVMSSASSFLSKMDFEAKNVIGEVKGQASEGVTDRDLDFAYYSSSKVVTNREVYLRAIGLAGLLEIEPADVVCVAAPLNSAFGMGAVVAAFVRNAACHLPDMSKVDIADSTILLAQEHQMEHLRKATKGAKLRGGAVQGECSGNDVLLATDKLGGTDLRIIATGSDSDTMRPLFDACKDTYYSYK
jgi:hypothetical protein